MSELDTRKCFTFIWRIWRLTGIHPPQTSTIKKTLYIVYGIIFNIISGIVSPISLLINVFYLQEIGTLIKTLQVSLYFCTLTVKQFMIFLNISKLELIKNYLRDLDKRANENKDELRYLTKITKQCRYIGLTIQVIFSFSTLPYSLSKFVKRRLLLEGWMPSDITASNYYYVAFALQFFPILFQIIQNTSNDSFSPVSINLLNGQIRVLCMRVARIGKDKKKTLDDNYDELKACINDHRNIIGLFNAIKTTISQVVLIQLIITGAVLCLTVFYYLKFNDSFGQLMLAIFDMVTILSVSFPVCYFGNSLMEETDRLTTAIYNCNWIDQTLKFQKTLIIFMQRSQIENVIDAGGLVQINLQTFTAIIRFSFSMFTVLSQLSGGIDSKN